MIGLILWVIIIGYPALFVWAYKKNKTWQTRLVWCGLLSVPLVAHYWDKPVIYYRHQQACAADGGPRVFVQPEKADRVQLDENSYYSSGGSAESVLQEFYPAIQVVEMNVGGGLPSDIKKYVRYSVDPASTSDGPNKYKFVITPLTEFTAGMYRLRKKNSPHFHGEKNQILLEKNGTTYAQWTQYSSIFNSDGIFPTSWQCFAERSEKFLMELLIK
jgi:hypothetical protein